MIHKVKHLSLYFTIIACSFLFFIPFSPAQNVVVRIGSGEGTPGSQGNGVAVSLENTVGLRGLQLAILDENNYLSATGCSTIGRASTLTCDINEKQYGWTILQLYSFGGDLIGPGNGPILNISYAVKGNAPPEECITLRILKKAREIESKASDENKIPLSLTTISGQFCFLENTDEEDEETEENAENLDDATEESMSETSTNQLSPGSNRINFSGGALQPTASNMQETETATVRSGGSSFRQPSTRGTASAPQESRRSTPASTSTPVSNVSGSSRTRVIVSPETATLTSGDLIILDPQTLDEGIVVKGDYTYEITPTSSIGSTISADGQFTAGINRSSEDIEETIKVTDTAHENASTSVVIIVAGTGEPSSECELSISPSSVTLSPGDSISFSVKNIGKKCSEGLYEWKVNSKIDSSINQQGIYRAGNNKEMNQVLDIVMVTDSVNKVSTDVIITVTGVSPAQKNPQLLETAGRTAYPKLLIFLTPLAIVVGFFAIRKFKN